MVHRKRIYSFVAPITIIMPTTYANQAVVIQSLQKFDGIFFTADTIEILRKYQRAMIALMNGERHINGSYQGKYIYKNNHYGSHNLAKIEQQLEAQKDNLSHQVYTQEKEILKELLHQALCDFKAISHEFEAIIRDTKAIVIEFIKESCLQRNRPDSILIKWSHTEPGEEFETLKKEADTLSKFDQFCADLLNFFNDLVHNCPKAKHTFDLRVMKWKKLRETLDSIKQSGRAFDENKFLKYIKQGVLDTLDMSIITTEHIKQLLENFEK